MAALKKTPKIGPTFKLDFHVPETFVPVLDEIAASELTTRTGFLRSLLAAEMRRRGFDTAALLRPAQRN